MRGLIATLDMMLALILITGIVTSSVYLMDNRESIPWEDIYLQRMGNDVLAVIEKTGGVDEYVLNSDERLIQNTTALVPASVCTKISFTEKGESAPFFAYTKPGCVFGKRQAVVRRQIFVYDANHILDEWVIAKAQVWYR